MPMAMIVIGIGLGTNWYPGANGTDASGTPVPMVPRCQLIPWHPDAIGIGIPGDQGDTNGQRCQFFTALAPRYQYRTLIVIDIGIDTNWYPESIGIDANGTPVPIGIGTSGIPVPMASPGIVGSPEPLVPMPHSPGLLSRVKSVIERQFGHLKTKFGVFQLEV